MRDIALYYPYIHVRDDAWLKAAALYWPKMARLTPDGYPKYDSHIAQQLSDELDFFVNIDPLHTGDVGDEFAEFILDNGEALQRRYTIAAKGIHHPFPGNEAWLADMTNAWGDIPADLQELEDTATHDEYFGRFFHQGRQGRSRGWVHADKTTYGLRAVLRESGLGVTTDAGWIVMRPELAAVYVTALAERVAQDNDLAVVTDSEGLHGIINGWNFDSIANALLGDDQEDRPALEADEIGELYAAVAIKTVVPARLNDVPIGKIITARRKLAAEFDAFRDHLSLLADRLTELGKIKDPLILQARLELMVERDLRRPTQELERKLRQLDLEPAQAVLGLKSLQLPAVAAAAASGAGLPVGASQAGLVAARLIASGVQSRIQSREVLVNSPAGYLLGLQKQLTPGGVVERLRRTMRRAEKSMRPSAG